MNTREYGFITKNEKIILSSISQIDANRKAPDIGEDFLYGDFGIDIALST